MCPAVSLFPFYLGVSARFFHSPVCLPELGGGGASPTSPSAFASVSALLAFSTYASALSAFLFFSCFSFGFSCLLFAFSDSLVCLSSLGGGCFECVCYSWREEEGERGEACEEE